MPPPPHTKPENVLKVRLIIPSRQSEESPLQRQYHEAEQHTDLFS